MQIALSIKTTLLACFVLLVCAHAQAQMTYEWSAFYAGHSDDEVHEIAFDLQGNSIVAGTYLDTVDFDPGPAIFPLIALTAKTAFVTKLSPAGDFLWAKEATSAGFAYIYSVDVDDAGNIYLGGIATDYTMTIAKWDANGNEL